jgi:hypothetical protein
MYHRDKKKAMNNGRDESGKEKPDVSKETSQYHKCGLMGHWKRECKTPDFHCQLWKQEQQRRKEQNGAYHMQMEEERQNMMMKTQNKTIMSDSTL